jgi:hypothetical protein
MGIARCPKPESKLASPVGRRCCGFGSFVVPAANVIPEQYSSIARIVAQQSLVLFI